MANYIDIGYDPFLDRSIDVTPAMAGGFQSLEGYISQSIAFDRVAVSGALGDKIQLGRILLDGREGRITMSDEHGITTLLIGEED